MYVRDGDPTDPAMSPHGTKRINSADAMMSALRVDLKSLFGTIRKAIDPKEP
jgi:hypothetical protein